ncbi:Coenzyme F420 hydrogenase/dehydrogenase, beta subunit C-terminal domain [Pseudoalteromonas sp. Cn5-37]|uniref:Coenzyme F420 hydrogenase/dehydrogenase, beta subunit C-terminal domain n=1 Tax=Pseudoalteromonas sp. Cn5-37 TaxID=2908886 RepID=UPI001F4639A4|nr:Coenzyme F420 hydrogenase/dehydrogenase, beta subunit C-terminal domain [Pseudoalteromonas sp. Cn5-37]MCF2917999.1 Coenzyme F420 hydrogenase/dehydrogenase, beta subunit C-terminal domain [Pseudoalteromonas sp. Cn5-37]
MSIEKAIENGFCVGCGVCKLALNNNIKISINEEGFYSANTRNGEKLNLASKLCPFSNDSQNETELGDKIYEDAKLKIDSRVGYYSNVYAGSVKDIKNKENSSSGGLTSWFIRKLLENKEVDAVIHVGQSESDSSLFEYKITESIEGVELKGNKKSRYYPVSLESIVDIIDSSEKKYVFVGIPCFVKAVRLAQTAGYLKNIKFCLSLLCGHMKSSAFAENLAWQVGVNPKNLREIDFRVKSPDLNANNYLIEVISDDERRVLERNFKLFGSDWGYGFFKHKACDFCDDLAGELADVTFGDAWLPKYIEDYQGTNIVVSRNNIFDSYLLKYSDELFIDTLNVDDFFDSQAANYRHRRDGLKTRIDKTPGWHPNKRLELSKSNISEKRADIYLYRYNLSRKSNFAFRIAKKLNTYLVFKLIMYPLVTKYEYKLRGFKYSLKYFLSLILPKFILKIVKK